MIVYNHDIAGLIVRMDRFVTELSDSVSGSLAAMSAADHTRLVAYIAAIRQYKAWVISQPELDLPESHPTQWTVADLPAVQKVENDDVNDLCRLWQLARVEISNSQSARSASGLIAFDASRFDAVINKIEKFLTDYIDKATPLDLPESSPSVPITAPGKTGV